MFSQHPSQNLFWEYTSCVQQCTQFNLEEVVLFCFVFVFHPFPFQQTSAMFVIIALPDPFVGYFCLSLYLLQPFIGLSFLSVEFYYFLPNSMF